MSEVLPPGFKLDAQPPQQSGLPAGFTLDQPGQQQITLEQEAQEVFGFDPDIVERGTILPIGVNREGEPELAIPQIGKELLTAFLIPGRAAKGREITPEEAAKFALDFAVPATARRLPTGPAARKLSNREIIRNAPTSEDILQAGGKEFKAARASGAKLSQDDFLDFASKVEARAIDEGVDPLAKELTPKIIDVLGSIGRRVGREVDVGGMQRIRRQLGIAAGSNIADERRIAVNLMDTLDDTVETVLRDSGSKNARRLWAAGKKSQTIEEIVDRATRQASGFENGLRIGFRQLLNNPSRLRGFSKAEQKVMREIEKGTPTRRALRFLARFGPSRSGSSNIVGSSIGSTGGFVLGGPAGMLAAPAAGNIASRAADKSAARSAELLRAIIASGPQATPNIPSRLPGIAMGAGFPLAGTQLPVVTQSEEDQQILQQMFGR